MVFGKLKACLRCTFAETAVSPADLGRGTLILKKKNGGQLVSWYRQSVFGKVTVYTDILF